MAVLVRCFGDCTACILAQDVGLVGHIPRNRHTTVRVFRLLLLSPTNTTSLVLVPCVCVCVCVCVCSMISVAIFVGQRHRVRECRGIVAWL